MVNNKNANWPPRLEHELQIPSKATTDYPLPKMILSNLIYQDEPVSISTLPFDFFANFLFSCRVILVGAVHDLEFEPQCEVLQK